MPAPAITEVPAPAPSRLIGGALRPHRWLRGLCALASVGVGAAVVLQAGAIAWAVDTGVAGIGAVPMAVWITALAAVAMRFALQWAREACARRLALAVRIDLREALRGRIDALGPPGVAGSGGGAVWVSRYQADVDALGGWFTRYLPARDAALIVPVLVLAAVAWLDWLAALLLLFAAPLIPLFMALVGLRSQQLQQRQQHEQHRLAAHFLDRLRALDLLRRSGALGRATREVFAAADRYRALSMRVLRVAFLSSAVMEFFSAVAIGLVAIYVGFGLLGSLQFGPAPQLGLFSGLFVLLLAPEFFLPLRQFAATWHDRAGALAAAAGLQPLLAGADTAPVPLPSPPPPGAVLALERASLAPAPGADPVLVDVDLVLVPGETVVVSGPSGSGKSTLMGACAGFVTLRSGQLRREPGVAWLGQSGHLFHGSIRDNLRLAAAPGTDDAVLADALAQAGLPVDDPALPEGLDTQVGEGRRGLSGGQAQRVALARAWLSGAPLWLLDEPTRGLDPETAAALWQRLLALARTRGAALLVATHDPGLAASADRVLRIVGGRLQEADDAPA